MQLIMLFASLSFKSFKLASFFLIGSYIACLKEFLKIKQAIFLFWKVTMKTKTFL